MKLALKSKQIFFWSAMGILFLGLALRMLMFFQNRSLFIDEAFLSGQIVERSYVALFENLNNQFAPPLFSVLVKLMTDIFGSNEFALRFIPLLASLLALVLFYILCRKFISDQYTLLPLFLMAFGMPMLQYATEVKQYSTDVLSTIVLLLFACNWSIEKLNAKRSFIWALLGVSVVWFSMPGVFILFGIGIYYLLGLYRKKLWNKMHLVIIPIGFWLLSFGIYYFTIIKNDLGIERVEDYHSRYFLPLFPTSLSDLVHIQKIIISLFRTAVGKTTLEIAFAVITSFWGIYFLRKKDPSKIWLLVLPILASMLASGLKLYSLIPRLTLFFIPIFILLIGIGQARMFKKAPSTLKYLLLIPVSIILFNQQGYQYFYKTFEIEEIKPVLYYVNDKIQVGDDAFLHFEGQNAYTYYSQFYQDAEKLNIPNIQIGHWSIPLESIDISKSDRIWLIFSHVQPAETERYIDHLSTGFKIADQFEATGAKAVLLQKE